MDTQERELDTTTDDGEMAVVITEPTGAPDGGGDWPTVLYFIDAPGLRPATRDSMALLAGNGYRVVTPDLITGRADCSSKSPKTWVSPERWRKSGAGLQQ